MRATIFGKFLLEGDSQEDDDYNPTKKEEAEYKMEQDRRKGVRSASCSAKQLFEEMKREQRQRQAAFISSAKTQQNEQNYVQIAQKILASESIKPKKRIVFAGKEFVVNQETGQLEQVLKTIEQVQSKTKTPQQNRSHSYAYLNHVLDAICRRTSKINSIGKSKLDWNGFVRKQGIADRLKYNRKGGVIHDLQFIRKDNALL